MSAEARVGSRTQALTLATLDGSDSFWPFPDQMHLTYCVDILSFGSNAPALLAAMDAAVWSWNRRVGAFLERIGADPCNNANGAVTFNVRSAVLSVTAAAFFPYHGRADRELLVDDTAFTTSTGGRDLEGILRHELGHVLGFRDEHIWLTPRCTPEGINELVDEGTLGARQLTDYDVDSVTVWTGIIGNRLGSLSPLATIG